MDRVWHQTRLTARGENNNKKKNIDIKDEELQPRKRPDKSHSML